MDGEKDASGDIRNATYDDFLAAADFKQCLETFERLCKTFDINPKNYKTVFSSLKSKLKLWKCQNLFNKLEKKSKHKDYQHKPCAKLKVLIIGAGPVGLRAAIEAAFLGAHVVVVEKRNSFSRNNVLHLWPFLIVDLKALGVKSFFGKFCAGSLDHISIRRLQCILLKMCLILGVQVHGQTMMEGLIEPSDGKNWRVDFKPESSPLNSLEFDAIVGCDGKNNALKFKRKEFRGKLAIAITCNFVNKQTSEEARVEEISGVAFIYNQEFFQQLFEKTGIELENIVYYKDETHYFVMTAKKKSLLSKGVIKQDSKDVFKLLSAENINHEKLCDFGKESADFATRYQLPHHEFAKNHYGKEDVALFDFTSIHQAENASKIIERKGKRLLLCIAGDILLEPFWPTGSGCARGFLGAFDAAWMIRKLGLGSDSVEMIQERESIFTLLPQTKPDSLMQSFDKYSIDPSTRYCNLNTKILTKSQARAFYDCTNSPVHLYDICVKTDTPEVTKKEAKVFQKKKDVIDPDNLLMWCREQTADFPNVRVTNLASSWKNGLAFCAIICRFHPELIDYSSLDPNDVESNCKKAFSVAEEHLGIPPKMSAHDFAKQTTPDTLAIVAYVSQYYEALKNETPAPPKKVEKRKLKAPESEIITNGHESPKMTKYSSKMSIVSKMSKNSKKKKKKLGKISKNSNKENKILNQDNLSQLTSYEKTSNDIQENTHNTTLQEISHRTALTESSIDSNKYINPIINPKIQENGSEEPEKYRRISNLAEAVFGDTIVQMGNPREKVKADKTDNNLAESEKCFFCNRKVFVMERQSAEGLFFHRKCFRCYICKCQLLLGNYVFHTDGDDQQYNDKFFCKMHYNKMIYDAEKKSEERKSAEHNKRPYSVLDVPKNEPVSKIRTATFGHIPSPKSSRIIDLQNRLQGTDLSDINEDESKPKGPYEKFAARQLNRHPSLLKCGARKVTTSSFFTSSKLSISTPNLSKLIQEDSMFEKERKEHAIEEKTKIFTTDDFEEDSEGHLQRQASIRSTTSIESTVPISAVNRRPISERRAQYPVSMAFSEGLVNVPLRPVSVDIQIEESPYDGDNSNMETSTFEKIENETLDEEAPVKMKKKRLVLKKKKKLIPGKELSGEITRVKTDEVDNQDKFGIHSIQEDFVVIEPMDEPIRSNSPVMPSRLDLVDDLSTSEDEMPVIKKKMGKKEKKQLAKEREAKQKAREERRVKKEMKAREMKRLWEAQSIQRKLCEVDVKQYELEKRAKQVETDLRDESLSAEKINELTFEWFSLVNEKNMLLRFESELVIAANSIRLEDRQARLEEQIRTLLQNPNPKRSSQKEIDRLTKEHVDTVEERNALVELLEEDRIREQEEDKLLQMTFSSKAHELGMDRLI